MLRYVLCFLLEPDCYNFNFGVLGSHVPCAPFYYKHLTSPKVIDSLSLSSTYPELLTL